MNAHAAAEQLLRVLHSDAFPFEKSEAAAALDKITGQSFGYDPDASDEVNQSALQRADAWLQQQPGAATAQ